MRGEDGRQGEPVGRLADGTATGRQDSSGADRSAPRQEARGMQLWSVFVALGYFSSRQFSAIFNL